MLIAFVVIYLIVSIGIGLWAAKRVHNSKDYLVAGDGSRRGQGPKSAPLQFWDSRLGHLTPTTQRPLALAAVVSHFPRTL